MSKRKLAYPSIEDVKRRVANTSIGASTLRGQGGSGLVETAREFLLEKIDLERLSEMPSSQFSRWLDEKTESLMREFQRKCGVENNWGAARKAINIFLENAFYDRFLAAEYDLDKLEDILEIPLDSNVVSKLCDQSNKFKKFKQFKIKTLKPDDSRELQERAKEIAKHERTSRIYLDLKYWRAKKQRDE